MLREAIATGRGSITQESIATEIGKTQTGVGKYLLDKGGALDLDEADAALRHIGSSLIEFLAGAPPRQLTDAERLGQVIAQRPGLRRVVELLLSVPKKRLDAVADLIQTVVLPAIGRSSPENDEDPAAPTPVRRTTKGARKRR